MSSVNEISKALRRDKPDLSAQKHIDTVAGNILLQLSQDLRTAIEDAMLARLSGQQDSADILDSLSPAEQRTLLKASALVIRHHTGELLIPIAIIQVVESKVIGLMQEVFKKASTGLQDDEKTIIQALMPELDDLFSSQYLSPALLKTPLEEIPAFDNCSRDLKEKGCHFVGDLIDLNEHEGKFILRPNHHGLDVIGGLIKLKELGLNDNSISPVEAQFIQNFKSSRKQLIATPRTTAQQQSFENFYKRVIKRQGKGLD